MAHAPRNRSVTPTPAYVARRRRPPAAKAAFGRSLGDFHPLLPGEQRLLQACRHGETARLGAELPDSPSDELRVRAAFLRFLLLGGDERAPVHERGVRLWGAFVEGVLDLGGSRVPHNVHLNHCQFIDLLFAQDARVEGLMTLEGSLLSQGINADRLRCTGGLFLRNGFKATGEVRLMGAEVGGDLECTGGLFEVKKGAALSADRTVLNGTVFFSAGFKATGEVRLLGAQIRGNLDCSGGLFEVNEGAALSADRAAVKGTVFFGAGFKATGKVRLLGAQIGGALDCNGGQFEGKEGAALSTEGAHVGGGWHFHSPGRPVRVIASHMQVAVLSDAIDSWAEGSVLDGLRYGALGGTAPTQAKARLAWLHKQRADHRGETREGEDFRPQPWRQLQRVLRDMGHAEDARQIGIAFEEKLRQTGRIGQSPRGTWGPVAGGKRVLAQAGHAVFGGLSGYGYRPMRLMGWMVLVWLLCALSYWWLALPPHDAIGPSDPLVFQHERYAGCNSTASNEKPAGNWYLCGPLPPEYSTFSPLAYSLDIILPLVDLGQEKAWGPLVPTPQAQAWKELLAFSPGHAVRWLIWFETLFGWIGSLLLVGIVSGFARRTEE